MTAYVIVALSLLPPEGFREHAAILVEGGRIIGVVDAGEVPEGYRLERLSAGRWCPASSTFRSTEKEGSFSTTSRRSKAS